MTFARRPSPTPDAPYNETQAGRVRSEPSGDWPNFAYELRVPAPGFWLTLFGGCLNTVTAVALAIWWIV